MARLSIILYQPEIPPNTGNIIRLCANTGAELHLIKPLSFNLSDKLLKRAGLDYHESARVKIWENFEECLQNGEFEHIYAMTTKGSHNFFETTFLDNSALLYGPETRGLPPEILAKFDEHHRCKLPMSETGRSLNLSNTVAIGVYEVWRQWNFISLS